MGSKDGSVGRLSKCFTGQKTIKLKSIKRRENKMIQSLGQVMLYVNDQDKSREFWTEKLGFNVTAEEDNGEGFRWIEVAPDGPGTSIVIHNKDFISKMDPELNLLTPSLMFFTENAEQLQKDLQNKNVKVGEIMELPSGKVFNFADYEENYFAVMERK
jgi:lactoylglutathione lyase